MEMTMKNKKKLIVCILVAIVIVFTLVIILLMGKDKVYRIIKIYEYDGKATVIREDIGEIEPYNNMNLESGDKVYLQTGNMTLRMDEDKYAYVEEDTEFSIQAVGSSEDSETTIVLNKGAITNEIQNALSRESSYEVNTPNSTMAVRGTVFRVSIYYDEEGICYTKITVFDGKVVSRLVYPDGHISEEEVSIEKGKEIIIYEDGETTDYLSEPTDIDYSSLPDDVVSLIKEIMGEYIQIPEEQEASGEAGVAIEYVVTFMNGGTTFASQTVKEGECATIPFLMPSATGDWDFDFATPITKNTIINWKE